MEMACAKFRLVEVVVVEGEASTADYLLSDEECGSSSPRRESASRLAVVVPPPFARPHSPAAAAPVRIHPPDKDCPPTAPHGVSPLLLLTTAEVTTAAGGTRLSTLSPSFARPTHSSLFAGFSCRAAANGLDPSCCRFRSAAQTRKSRRPLIDSSCASGQQCIGGTVCDLRTMKCLCPVGTVPHMDTLSCVGAGEIPSTSSTTGTGSDIRLQPPRLSATHPTLSPYLPQALPITPTTSYGIPYSIVPTPSPMNTNQQQPQPFYSISPQPFPAPTSVPTRPAPYMNPNQPAPVPTRQPYIYPEAQSTYLSLPTPTPSMNNFATVAPGSSCRNGQKCTGGSLCNHMVGVCMCPSNTEDQGGTCVIIQLEKVRVGDRCDRFSECGDDSTCFQGRCQCVSPLTLHNGKCIPQQAVGARVESGGVQTVFVTSGGQQLGSTNQAGVGAKCALNTECMIGAYCNGNTNPPSCQCLSTHVNIEGKCHK
uniref:EGF-like domain-containing protein n=1 Tax=Plectus sambesii TaxID=2011161 RepID=A0A914VSS2_9BILA